MSYFIVISGAHASDVDVISGRLVSTQETQSYVARLAPQIEAVDGNPSFFWDDDETGTSDVLVSDFEVELLEKGRSVEGTVLGRVIKNCELLRVTIRIWWAGNDPQVFSQVPEVKTAAAAFALIQVRAGGYAGASFVLRPSNLSIAQPLVANANKPRHLARVIGPNFNRVNNSSIVANAGPRQIN